MSDQKFMDIMLDLETMGTSSHAAIAAIGMVAFNLEDGPRPLPRSGDHTLYIPVDLESSVRTGGVMDVSTVQWWLQQSDTARAEIHTTAGAGMARALEHVADWIDEVAHRDDVRIWGNGAAFDNVILRNAFERIGFYVPWKFYNDRCYRTIKSLRPDVLLERTGTQHHALVDALQQTDHLLRIYDAMKQRA
jgi:exodeoxyribonuclease VIII